MSKANNHVQRLAASEHNRKMTELAKRIALALESIANALIRLSSCVSIPEEEE